MHYIYAYVMNPKEQAFSDCKLNDHHTFILAKKTEIPLFFSGNKQDQDLAYIEPQFKRLQQGNYILTSHGMQKSHDTNHNFSKNKPW
jgi:hypothetical protein